MDTNQTTITCAKSPTGKHEDVYYEAIGEVCKHCRRIRDGAEPQPALKKEEQPAPIPQAAVNPEVPTKLLDDILRVTGSKATVVITFSEPLTAPQTIIQQFHITSANVDMRQIQDVLLLLYKAMTGRAGGNLNMRSDDIPKT